jgi:hypothetical protein
VCPRSRPCRRCTSPAASRDSHASDRPTAKQRLSAIRHLFDWLVVGQVMPVNPASSVRGPSGVFVRARQCRGRHEGRGRVRAEPPAHGTASRAACLPSRAAAPSHNLETYLHAYLDGGGTAADPKGPLFRTIGRTTGQLTRTPLPQANAHAMIRRRPAGAGIKTQVGNHTFRATGITAYLKNGGTRENGAAMANHASTRTTQLYDGGRDEGSLDEVERISI